MVVFIFTGLAQSLWPEVAVKIQDKLVISAQGYEDNVRNEIDVLRRVDHPGVIKLIGHFETDSALWMVLELGQGGDLQKLLSRRGSLDCCSAAFYTAEIVLGLHCLHR